MRHDMDYSPHYIDARLKMKSMYAHVLVNDFDKALEEGTQALVELRMALTAIRDIKDNLNFRK